jgi:hypothetical protein
MRALTFSRKYILSKFSSFKYKNKMKIDTSSTRNNAMKILSKYQHTQNIALTSTIKMKKLMLKVKRVEHKKICTKCPCM